jgi:hypothetical protein
MTAIEAWAIKAPDGRLCIWTISIDEDECMRKALYNHVDMKTHSCVRVRVGEIENTSTSRKE